MNVDLSATRGCHCLAARRNARAITRLFEEKLRPHGLRATQFSVLAVLALKGSTRVTELAAALGLERTTLTRVEALLERNGWVRTGESEDARARPLRLTGAGRRKLEEAYPAWKEAQDLVGRRSAVDFEPPRSTKQREETVRAGADDRKRGSGVSRRRASRGKE